MGTSSLVEPISADMVAPASLANRPADLFDLVGNTPLVRTNRLRPENRRVSIYAKAEWTNPGGSVKDRPARQMILEGERTGRLRPGKILLDATSGNTGIAYAMLGAARGYPVHLCLPVNANEERKQLLRAYGAHLILTDPRLSSDGAILKARELYAAEPDKYFYPDQYNNPANWQAHYETTGPEIWKQTGGRITHFVAGLGTSGTFMGTGRRLARAKSRHPADLVSARLAISRPGGHEVHGDLHRARHLRRLGWPTRTAKSAPRTRTPWCKRWRAKRGYWSASRRGSAGLLAAARGGADRRRHRDDLSATAARATCPSGSGGRRRG